MKVQNVEQDEAQFQQWLERMPTLHLGEQTTVNIPITLGVDDWADLIQGSVRNGWSISEAITFLLRIYRDGVVLEWCNQNFETEDEREERQSDDGDAITAT